MAPAAHPRGRGFIQSGNIGGDIPDGLFIIDQTVERIHCEAVRLVEMDPAFARFRPALADDAHMAAHARLRRKYFLPVRPLEHYLEVLRSVGFKVLEVEIRASGARVEEWCSFLAVYHEGVLGRAGGAERITGGAAPEETVAARLALLEAATQRVFGGRETFEACWTYLTAAPAQG